MPKTEQFVDRFEIRQGDGGFHWVAIGGNNEDLYWSEPYGGETGEPTCASMLDRHISDLRKGIRGHVAIAIVRW